jgi:hypothetical protein
MARAGKSAPVPPHLEPAEASSLTIPSLPAHLHRSWGQALEPLTRDSGWPRLMHFLAEERAQGEVFPAEADVFSAFLFTPLDRVKVVILGQDPYPTPGAAHGLCFSVLPGIKLPASLRNIYRELQDDVGVKPGGAGGSASECLSYGTIGPTQFACGARVGVVHGCRDPRRERVAAPRGVSALGRVRPQKREAD